MIDPLHIAFLHHYNVGAVRHSGRSLFEHLTGTHKLLEAWHNPAHVCTGGLFHSIYGTNVFQHKVLEEDDRDELRALIGEQAENLAWLFGTLGRPRALFHPPRPNHIPHLVLQELREIEAANLLEQGSHSPWLGRLLDSDISADAKAAIAQHIKEDA